MGFNSKESYNRVYENVAFQDWKRFGIDSRNLAKKVIGVFPENEPFMKLIGSSATHTMRKNHKDMDYAVAFEEFIQNSEFLKRISEAGLKITKIKENKDHKYLKVSGTHNGTDFVLVPLVNPRGNIEDYAQDAFYHPDLINSMKSKSHRFNVILAKEFFSQLGIYKQVKGLGCELLILKYVDFDSMLEEFRDNKSVRVNFSENLENYSSSPLIIDYPFLGGREINGKITSEMYQSIRNLSKSILDDPRKLGNKKNG
jgi:tRNA nucleotidyltransferase (CCA-adding enzyme)